VSVTQLASHPYDRRSKNYYAPARREGGNKRCFSPSVCPSVRPSRIKRILRESKDLAGPNLEGGTPPFLRLAYRFPGQKVKGQGHQAH